MNKKLGKLERVELRNIWSTEDGDFTPWLAKKENIEILGDAIGIELEVEAQEKDVGPFRADILCRNIADDSFVLIENQIEKTDHKHLGQLLTYAAGLQTVTIIWVASKFTEEHRAALDWLNGITSENFRFFGLEVELWQIDDSAPAPKFNIVSQPNDWSKYVSSAARNISNAENSETKQMQYKFWTKFSEYLKETGSKMKPQRPGYQHWLTFTVGRSYFHINALLSTREERIGVDLYLGEPEYAKHFFNILKEDKEKIEAEIGSALDWKELPEKRASRIILTSDMNPSDESNWSSQFKWLKDTLEKFDSAFRNRIKNLEYPA
ncbi:MAG TPA: DUF4268 domain-containing protein [Alphaproteobacteria bacterium]|nr:DUF4268 domain-containing protein [Alphaproteobacteria bacterium]